MVVKVLGVGTDIEVFLRETETKKPIPVCGLLGGTKQEPRTIASLGSGFCVQEDNVAAEFNIPAARESSRFTESLFTMRGWLSNHFKKQGLELAIEPSMLFEMEQLKSRQAQTFGCDPDFCAWRIEEGDCENEIDTHHPLLQQMRTAGGHVHVSFTVDGNEPELQDIIVFVKALDVFLGVGSCFLDKDLRRKQFYGKAGAFRPKQYAPGVSGVEYRTLSNFWFASEEYQFWLFNGIFRASNFINSNQDPDEVLGHYKADLLQAIDHGNLAVAEKLVRQWHLELPRSCSEGRIQKGSISPPTLADLGDQLVAAAQGAPLQWTATNDDYYQDEDDHHQQNEE